MNKHIQKNVTLDTKHNEMLNKFKHNEKVLIPKYNDEIIKLETSLNNIKTRKQLEKKEIIENKITTLKNKIYKMNKEQKDYYLNNSKYIYRYFEEKKNISNENTYKLNNDLINNFFDNNIVKNVNINTDEEQLNNINKYFYNVNSYLVNYDNFCYNSDICNICKIGELVYVESEGICICKNCSKTFKYLIENEKPSYKEPPKETSSNAYQRINHLREILAQFQAKESTNIPQSVFDNIKKQVKKERLKLSELTNEKTKEILKNLGYSKYYEHIPFIKDKLGIPPPLMDTSLEEKLCNLFLETQKPYSKYCPDDRVNFLHYYYTLYKLCELLGETKYLSDFPMLKDRQKIISQDEIWEKICADLGWEFIPTQSSQLYGFDRDELYMLIGFTKI